MRWSARVLVLTLAAGLLPAATPAAQCAAPKAVVTTAVGMKYRADPAFEGAIATQAQRARQDGRAQLQAGKLIVYASTPIRPRGGGHVETNLEIAAAVKSRLEKEYGGAVRVLDPGRYLMPDVGGKSPGGAEYVGNPALLDEELRELLRDRLRGGLGLRFGVAVILSRGT